MKNAVAPFALALPLCAAMAVPAAASQFWDFTLSWGNAQLTGVTGPTSAPFSNTFNLTTQLSGVFFDDGSNLAGRSGQVFWYSGDIRTGQTGQGQPGFSNLNVPTDTRTLNFSSTVSSPDSADSATISGSFLFTVGSPWSGQNQNQNFWYSTNGSDLRFGTLQNNSLPDDRSPGGNRQTTQIAPSFGASATLVPEINGSGFAYIAFILGALGLWIYSGGAAALTRPREEAVTA